MQIRHVGFLTSAVLATGAIGFGVAAAMTASTVALVAYSILAVGCGVGGIAAITALFGNPEPKTVSEYSKKLGEHLTYGGVAVLNFFSTIVISALGEGLGRGIAGGIERRLNPQANHVHVHHH